MPKNPTRNNSIYRPQVPYQVAKQSYFIHNDQVHSVASCPSATFRDAVLALASHWADSEAYGPLIASCDDLADRWFLLCGLCEAKRVMTLYADSEEAEQAVRVVAVGG